MSEKLMENQMDQPMTRRGFLKTTAVTCAAIGAPVIFTGCKTVQYPADDCLIKSVQGGAALSGKKIFEEASFGPIPVKNRLVRSATSFHATDEYGRPTQKLLDIYSELGQGGVGTIITGMTDTGLLLDNETFREQDMEAHRKVPERIHSYGAAAIQQLSHRGSQLETASDEDLFSINRLSDLEIEQIIERFVKNIERSRRMGFDGVQLHGAHGYLLSEFLSPAMNRRTDKWGGSTENRFRIVNEIIKRSKQKQGAFPVFIKINAYDFQKKGMREPESINIAKLLEKAGCDGIEVSCGVARDGFSTLRVTEIPMDAITAFGPFKDASRLTKFFVSTFGPFAVGLYTPLFNYNVCAAAEIKKQVTIPVMVVGGIRTRGDMEAIVQHDLADFVALSRPLIIEPGIVNSLKDKSQTESECINCGYCLIGHYSRDVHCYYGKV